MARWVTQRPKMNRSCLRTPSFRTEMLQGMIPRSKNVSRRRPRQFGLLLVGQALLSLTAAYQDEGCECRSIRLDETALDIPAHAPAERNPIFLGSVDLTDDKDLTPLLESDRTLGDGATLRFRAYLSNAKCSPSSIALYAEKGALQVQVDKPQGSDWAAKTWQDVSIPIPRDAYSSDLAWADLVRMKVGYTCSEAAGDKDTMKIELLRLCKRVASPSFCLVESSDVYKADCKECNCQTCHSCQCVFKLSEHCPYDTCDSCLGAPLIKCCYEADCRYQCQCQSCCDSHSFVSCSKGLHYGVESLSPASGPEKGGNVVKFKPTTVFADSAHALCRFDLAVVSARVLSQHELECNAPPHAGGDMVAEGVPVQVSLDGRQWSTEPLRYRYCKPGSQCHVCAAGWKGANCTIQCQGGAASPCHKHGRCLDDPPGECACEEGFGGRACDVVLSSAEGGRAKGGSTKKGVMIGIGLSLSVMLLAVLGVVLRRREVGEWVMWSLASTRWQRLNRPSPIDGRGHGVGAWFGGGGGQRAGGAMGHRSAADDVDDGIMLTQHQPGAGGRARIDYAHLRLPSEDEDEEADVTML